MDQQFEDENWKKHHTHKKKIMTSAESALQPVVDK